MKSQFGLRGLRRRWPAIFGRCGRWLGESGGSLVELALILPIIGIPMLLGTFDMGMLAYDSIEIANAAHAGALNAMWNGGSLTSVTAVAQAEATNFVATANGTTSSTLIVTPTSYFICSSVFTAGATTPQYTNVIDATSACPAGANNHYLQFVQVTVSGPVTIPYSCCGLPTTTTLTSTSTMEVEP